jgi:hypothetical protein
MMALSGSSTAFQRISDAIGARGMDLRQFDMLRKGVFTEHDPEKWGPVFGKDHALSKEPLAAI